MSHSRQEDLQNTKQLVSLVTGGALALAGVRRRGFSGALLGLGGAAILYRAASARAPLPRGRRERSLRDTLRRGAEITGAVTIQRPISDVYSFFREVEGLEPLLPGITSIERRAEGEHRWTLRAGRKRLHFDTALIAEETERRVEWMSLPGGDIEARGRFLFHEAPGDRGTEVRARLHYAAHGLHPLNVLAPFFRRFTRAQLSHGLARIKQRLEAGEVATNATRPEPRERRERLPEERPPGLEPTAAEVSR